MPPGPVVVGLALRRPAENWRLYRSDLRTGSEAVFRHGLRGRARLFFDELFRQLATTATRLIVSACAVIQAPSRRSHRANHSHCCRQLGRPANRRQAAKEERLMEVPSTQKIFPAVEAGDLDAIRRLLDDDPGLVHVRHADRELHHWTPLQFAAAKRQLGACRLLVDRGAEVYTNPMNTYPPVMLAAWNRHAEVVKYFLDEIPDRAAGTNGLGVTINLAARQGWIEIVRKHIERDPLSVHQRGWIGDAPLHWASHNNYPEIVSLLLDGGADIEADEINCYGGKPL